MAANQQALFFRLLAADKGLLVKDSYWRWPERNLAGNAIDFFVQVLNR